MKNILILVLALALLMPCVAGCGSSKESSSNQDSCDCSDHWPQFDGGYPEGYKIKPIVEQIEILQKFFPELASVDKMAIDEPLPTGAEGWFAIPVWEAIAPTYSEAVRKVITLLCRAMGNEQDFTGESLSTNGYIYGYGVSNIYAPDIKSETLWRSPRTNYKLFEISRRQGLRRIMIVPAQFGLFHRYCSIPEAEDKYLPDEFGLGAFEVAIMLLTHPERMIEFNDLLSSISCPGDYYKEDGFIPDDHMTPCTPCFSVRDNMPYFCQENWAFNRFDHCVVTGFLPERYH